MSQAVRSLSVRYDSRSAVQGAAEAQGSRVVLGLDAGRGAVGFHAQVRDAGLLRDALMTAVTVLGSDLRHKSKDRAAYLAYLAKQGKKATAAIWEAQKAFLDQSFADDQQQAAVLEPVLTVHPDEISLEVFSRDESAYARLALHNDLFDHRQARHGSTFVDLPPALVESLDRLRGYVPVSLEASAAGAAASPTEQRLDVPYAWLRGFLQVQSAATLPAVRCDLGGIDVYNLLFALRMRKAKKSPRALRFELVPGSPPRLVLEPWEIVLEGHGAPFQGKAPRVVRTFGRQRLLALARILPYVKGARVHLLGPGLPVFWVLDLGAGSLTLALTGWTESGWAGAASFDALMPPATGKEGEAARKLADQVSHLLHSRGPVPLAEIAKNLPGSAPPPPDRLHAAMQVLCLRGQVVYDLSREVYRPRDLLGQPIEEALIRYGSERETSAHRLLGDGRAGEGEIKLTKLHEIAGEGIEVQGEVTDRVARRTYSPRFTLDLEGRARDASCACPVFRRTGMREGPCEHLLALRLAYARRRAEEEARRLTPEGRSLIRAETRTLVRREPSRQESVYRVSLDDRLVRLVWGTRADAENDNARQQRLWFDSDGEARSAYFARLDRLAQEGYIDADAF